MCDIKFGICGDLDHHGTAEEHDPFVSLKKAGVKKLIYDLNREPMAEDELFSEYEGLAEDIERLLRLEFLKVRGKKIYVNFTFLDEADNRLLFDVCQGYAQGLVEEIISERALIEGTLSRYRNPRVCKEKLAFFVIGCYFLDWGSLDLFRRWDIADNLKPRPGGNEYVLWGERVEGDLLKGVYWGGHMLPDTDPVFHTFGDHHVDTERRALPDLLHLFHGFDFPGGGSYRTLLFERRKELASELAALVAKIGKDGTDVSDLTDGTTSKEHISLLKEMNYVEEEAGMYYLAVPYFDVDDIEMIYDCISPFVPVLRAWLSDNLDSLRLDLEDARPLRNGVSFDEFFIQVWHVIFGLANRRLASEGLIYDTYAEDSKHPGYLPAVADKELLDSLERLL